MYVKKNIYIYKQWIKAVISIHGFFKFCPVLKKEKKIFLELKMLRTLTFEFTALEHKFKSFFCTQKSVLNDCFKDLWYTKIHPTQIWYDKFN